MTVVSVGGCFDGNTGFETGIEEIFQKKETELSCQIPEELDSAFAPSHWFG